MRSKIYSMMREIPSPASKSNVSPLSLLRGDEDDPNNAVDYSDEDYLDTFEDGDQAPIEHDRAPAMYNESLQSQDEQQRIQPSGIEGTRAQSINEARRDGFSLKGRRNPHSKNRMGAKKAGLLRHA
jgi:hypothetical protein